MRKSSPNTLELLGTKYCIVNRDYHKIFNNIANHIDTITTLPDWTYQLVLEPSDAEYYRSIKKCDFDIIFRPDYFDNRCFETQMLLDNYFKNRFNDSVGWIQELINNYQKQIMEKYLKLTF